jgi:hypothetical protein
MWTNSDVAAQDRSIHAILKGMRKPAQSFHAHAVLDVHYAADTDEPGADFAVGHGGEKMQS